MIGIGGTVGAYWRRAGHDVLFVDRDADHVAAINQTGLAINGPIEEFSVKAPAALPKDVKGNFDTVFLCVKAPDTASASEALAPFVADKGCVVSLQNGLNERVIAKRLGAERTIGAFFDQVVGSTKKGDKVAWPGFGSFSTGKRAARVGRNPQTGAEVKIKASTTMKFTASSTLKAALNPTKKK